MQLVHCGIFPPELAVVAGRGWGMCRLNRLLADVPLCRVFPVALGDVSLDCLIEQAEALMTLDACGYLPVSG